MIGTENGIWFAIKELPDGTVDYAFYRVNDKLEDGVASSIDDMYLRFDALSQAAARPHS